MATQHVQVSMARERPFTPQEQEQVQRFIECLRRAMIVGGHSQRRFSESLGITIGSMTKYLRGEISPLKVGLGIQARLAHELGITLDALYGYYLEGAYLTDVSVDAVESWIRSEAGQEDLPRVLSSLKDATERLAGVDMQGKALPPAVPEPYTWPIEELNGCRISAVFRNRMGLTDEALKKLATQGEFTPELAEAFGIACNYETEAVIEAFRERRPVA